MAWEGAIAIAVAAAVEIVVLVLRRLHPFLVSDPVLLYLLLWLLLLDVVSSGWTLPLNGYSVGVVVVADRGEVPSRQRRV